MWIHHTEWVNSPHLWRNHGSCNVAGIATPDNIVYWRYLPVLHCCTTVAAYTYYTMWRKSPTWLLLPLLEGPANYEFPNSISYHVAIQTCDSFLCMFWKFKVHVESSFCRAMYWFSSSKFCRLLSTLLSGWQRTGTSSVKGSLKSCLSGGHVQGPRTLGYWSEWLYMKGSVWMELICGRWCGAAFCGM